MLNKVIKRPSQLLKYKIISYVHGYLYCIFCLLGVDDNPCALNCMPKYERFAKTLREKVVDGTRCDKSTYDMCVDGVCVVCRSLVVYKVT